MGNEWGFTDSTQDFDRVIAFREAAIADGWSHEPTYGVRESEDRAAKLTRDGFCMHIISRQRDAGKKWRYEANVFIWGPDGLCIKPSDEYDWAEIQAGLRHCSNCGATDVDTQRYGFAGRCCVACLPAMRKKHEYPGWCD